MFRSGRFIACGLAVLGSIVLIDTAQASTVNLVGGWNVNWDINGAPAESPSTTIQIQNSVASSTPIFNGYDLGLKFVLVSGSGQIALDNASNPLSGSVLPSWFFSPPVSGPNSVYNIGADAVDYAVPNTPTNLVTLDFKPGTTTPTVGSVFEIVADHTLSDYLDHLGNSTMFANDASGDFVLGTVTITAVPEPSSIITWAGIAALGLVVTCARRKGNRNCMTNQEVA